MTRRSPISTATRAILLHRGYPIDQLAEQSHYLEVCYLLLYGELPSARELEDFENRHHPSHHAARADGELLPGLPARCAPDGDHGLRGRCDVGLLSRLDRHRRSAAAMVASIRMIAKAADDLPPGPTSTRSASPSCTRATISTTRRTSCTCALPCPCRGIQGRTRSWPAPWTGSSSCTPITSRTPRPRRCGWRARRGANPFACIAAGIACLWGPGPWRRERGGCLEMLKEIAHRSDRHR